MSSEPFWEFSLALYAKPGVSAACLALQDEFGADVDMVLFALWCARLGHGLSAAEVDSVDAAIVVWRKSVVQPIRAARRACSPALPGAFDADAAAALRKQLLAAELAAERMQQRAMQALAPAPGTLEASVAARGNLACFARQAGVPADAAPFAVLLAAFA